MKNKLMLLGMMISVVCTQAVLANNEVVIALGKYKLVRERDQLLDSLTEEEKAAVLKNLEDIQKERLQKFLDENIKSNLSAIGKAEQEGVFKNPDKEIEFILSCLGKKGRLSLVELIEAALPRYKECLKNENNSAEFCDMCLLVSGFQHIEFALDYVGLDVLDTINPNPHPYNDLLAEQQ